MCIIIQMDKQPFQNHIPKFTMFCVVPKNAKVVSTTTRRTAFYPALISNCLGRFLDFLKMFLKKHIRFRFGSCLFIHSFTLQWGKVAIASMVTIWELSGNLDRVGGIDF